MSKFKQLLNCHAHSHYSLDGAATVDDMLKRSVELGASHLTLTEHGNMASALELYTKAKKYNIKPIAGIELYVQPPFLDEVRKMIEFEVDKEGKAKNPEDRENKIEKALKGEYVHLTVHFKDEWAYQYFCRLSATMESRAVVKFGERKPIATIEEIAGAAGHITICSSCLIGVVSKFLLPRRKSNISRPDLAEKAYHLIREIAGKDNFFVEVFPDEITHDWKRGDKGQPGRFIKHECTQYAPEGDLGKPANQFVIDLATKNNDPILVSLDAHFAWPEQHSVQTARLSNGKDDWKFHNSYHMKSSDDAFKTLNKQLGIDEKTMEKWIDNSYLWASNFNNFKMTTSKDRWVLQALPADWQDQFMAKVNAFGRMNWNDPVMMDRLKYEIDIIAYNGMLNLVPYLLTVGKIADFCKENEILLSVRGCLVGETLVRMADGSLKRLDKINAGDFVITHEGNAKRVLNTQNYDIKGETLLKIKTDKSESSEVMTKDHKVFGYKRTEKYRSGSYKDSRASNDFIKNLSWHKMQDLSPGDYLFHPWPKERRIKDLEVIDLSNYYKSSRLDQEFIYYNINKNKKNDLFSIKGVCSRIKVHPVYFRNVFIKKNKIPSKKWIESVTNKINECTGLSLEEWLLKYKKNILIKTNRFIELDEECAYFIGKWIGDGWITRAGRAGIAFHKKDTVEINRTLLFFNKNKIPHSVIVSKTKQLVQLAISHHPIINFLKSMLPEYKSTSKSKYMGDFKFLPDAKLKSLINGLISADGYRSKCGKVVITTTSNQLLSDIRESLMYLKTPSNVTKREPCLSGGYICRESYSVQFRGGFSFGKTEHTNESGFLLRIKEITEIAGISSVYDIEVEDDHSYLTNNFTVHNSAGGSLLLYLLGISGVNPLKYDLSFDRFVTKGRIISGSLPDADLDTSSQERVFEFLSKEYGDGFCNISISTQLKLKSSIKDTERQELGSVTVQTEKLCKTLPLSPQGVEEYDHVFGYTDEFGHHIDGVIETNPQLRVYSESHPERWKQISEMLGIQRQISRHACASVIIDKPVQEFIPVTYVSGVRVTGVGPKMVETAGLIKYDILGLNTLRDMEEALKLIKERTGLKIDPWNLPDDERCWDMFRKGDTSTVFQFDTHTVRPYLQATNPSKIEDLIALTALCRPGTLQAPEGSGSTRTLSQVYVARSRGEPVVYIHKDLEPIFGETYGIALYQEQSLRIFRDIAGYSAEEAESVRRAIGKKDAKLLAEQSKALKERCLARNWTEAQADLLIEQLMASARYSFNKSHAAAYGVVAYACMWLKVNHPLEWWAAILSNASKDDLRKYWVHVENLVKLPDINNSKDRFTIVDNKETGISYIQAPITLINGIGQSTTHELMTKAPFASLDDLVTRIDRRVVNKRVMTRLVFSGTVDSLFQPGLNEAEKLDLYFTAKAKIEESKKEPVPLEYLSFTPLKEFLFKKSIFKVFSQDLMPAAFPVLQERGLASYNRLGFYQYLDPNRPKLNGSIIVNADRYLQYMDEVDKDVTFGLICYVGDTTEKTFTKDGVTKGFLKITLEVDDTVIETVKFPDWGETDHGIKKDIDGSIALAIVRKAAGKKDVIVQKLLEIEKVEF